MKKKILNWYFILLGRLAHAYLQKHKPLIIGINGSVGKTSCRMIIYQTLCESFPQKTIYTSPKNFNGELGLSLSIFQIEEWEPAFFCVLKTLFKVLKKRFSSKKIYDLIILEYGIDRPKEMEFLLSIAKPHIGVFTALDAVHSEQFGNPAAIAQEEIKMVLNTLETVFLNESDGYAMHSKSLISGDCFTYQTEGFDSIADIHFSEPKYSYYSNSEFPNILMTELDLQLKDEKIHIQTNLIGKPNYGYIALSLMIAEILAYKRNLQLPKKSNLKLSYQLQEGRFSLFQGKEDALLFDSTYNASPLSMRKIIDTVSSIQKKLFPSSPIWLVLGDMRELGDLTEKEHRLLAAYLSQVADRLFLVGESMKIFTYDELSKVGFPMAMVQTFDSSLAVAEEILSLLPQQKEKPLLVLKGSQNTIFLEETVKKLLADPKEKKHLTRQSKRRLETKKSYFASLTPSSKKVK